MMNNGDEAELTIAQGLRQALAAGGVLTVLTAVVSLSLWPLHLAGVGVVLGPLVLGLLWSSSPFMQPSSSVQTGLALIAAFVNALIGLVLLGVLFLAQPHDVTIRFVEKGAAISLFALVVTSVLTTLLILLGAFVGSKFPPIQSLTAHLGGRKVRQKHQSGFPVEGAAHRARTPESQKWPYLVQLSVVVIGALIAALLPGHVINATVRSTQSAGTTLSFRVGVGGSSAILACMSDRMCLASTSSGELLRYTGANGQLSHWSMTTTRPFGSSSTVDDLACTPSGLCVAQLGNANVPTASDRLELSQDAGLHWHNAVSLGSQGVETVACSPTTCFAVLLSSTSDWTSRIQTITTSQHAPVQSWTLTGVSLSSMSCPTSTWCVAAGTSDVGSSVGFLMADGVTWNRFDLGRDVAVTSVSCSLSRQCVAGGNADVGPNADPGEGGIAAWKVSSDGGYDWTRVSLGDTLNRYAMVWSVSCATGGFCSELSTGDVSQPFVFRSAADSPSKTSVTLLASSEVAALSCNTYCYVLATSSQFGGVTSLIRLR